MSFIYWRTCNLTDNSEINEKYRDDVKVLVDALYEDKDLSYEFVSNEERSESQLGLFSSKRRCKGKSGFYRSPFLPIMSNVDSGDQPFFLPDFKYYLIDYYSDHEIIANLADLSDHVFDDWVVRHIFQELMYRIVDDNSEYHIKITGHQEHKEW